MKKKKEPQFPTVRFFGSIRDEDGEPMVGRCYLMPEWPFFHMNEVLYATQAYNIELGEGGAFDINVLPTNVGVDTVWTYQFHTPYKSWRVSLPKGGEHNFDAIITKDTSA